MTTGSTGDPVLSFPRVVRIEPAGKCNLSCIHCPTGTVEMERGLMEWTTFQRVLVDIQSNSDAVRVVVLYHGGEPLLNKRFYDMVREIKRVRSDIFVKTVSNGTAITEGVCTKLVECGIDAVEVSLDGDSTGESDRVRVGSKAEKIISNIKLLLGKKRQLQSNSPDVFVSTTQFLADVSGDFPVPKPGVPTYLLREFEKGNERISGFKSTYAFRWAHMGSVDKDFDVYVDPHDTNIRNECDYVNNTITVRWDGTVVPCCYDLTSRLVMGSVLSESLSDIWRSRKYEVLRDSIARREFISICNDCGVVKPAQYLVPKWRSNHTTGPSQVSCES